MAGLSFPARGEVYWANLDPTFGTEIAKTRPAVIVSSDIGNEHSPRVTIAAITSRGAGRVFPFEVLIRAGEGGLSQTSKVLLNQIRSIDKRRLGRRMGRLNAQRMHEIDEALRFSLSL